MRAVALLLVACGACATTLRDVPPGRKPDPSKALIAARMEFGGTRIDPTMRLRSLQGQPVNVRPEYATFLVELAPGTYELERFGDYVPRADRLTFEAEAGVVRYIGSFQAGRDEYGDLQLIVQDEMMAIAEELVDRYGPELPDVLRGMVRSALVPVDREIAKLVIPLARVAPSYPPVSFSIGLGFYGVYGGWGHGGHHGHGSGGATRGSHASRGSRHSRASRR